MKQITFIDQATIKIKAGRGGDGRMGFHREKYVEEGGPSGGNGGNGGSIFFYATNNENTLLEYRGRSIFKGNNGINGGLKNMTGANGKDIFINIPVGTEILENGIKIADLSYDGQIWLGSQGGRGGRGNKSFKSSKNTTPTLFEHGEEPEWRELTLNLKFLADVGLLGYPNAGKSTLLSSISNAKPKIANYEFTTLVPQLGVVKNKNKKFVITDLPGLIDGASENRGMGIQFLKHLSRTKIILHLIDSTNNNFKEKYESLRKELKNFSSNLNNLLEIIVFSKIDLIDEKRKKIINQEFKNKKIYFISSLTKDGLEELLDEIIFQLDEIDKKEKNEINKLLNDDFIHIKFKNDFDDELQIEEQDGIWTISNTFTKFWAKRIPLTSEENTWRIISKFKTKGIIEQLKFKGLKNEDLIVVKDTPFVLEYNEEE